MRSKTITLPCLFLVAIMTLFGCRSEAPPETGSEKTTTAPEATSTDQPQGAQASNLTDKALVQVLIYGLSTLRVEKDQDGTITAITAITALLPPAIDHVMALDRVDPGSKKWKRVEMNDQSTTLRLDDSTIRLLVGGNPICSPQPCLSERRGMFPLGDYPSQNSDDGADVRWMVNYKDDLEESGAVKPGAGTTRMVFDAGTLETCGLVHPPRDFGPVCRVSIPGNNIPFVQSASEYMVVRHTIPKDSKLQVIVIDAQGTQTVTIKPSDAGPVIWNGATYDQVYDIALRNTLESPTYRPMVSDHGNLLRAHFDPVTTNSWAATSPDCNDDDGDGKWICTTCQTCSQPPCWDYFRRLFPQPGGSDRPICPLVGYP